MSHRRTRSIFTLFIIIALLLSMIPSVMAADSAVTITYSLNGEEKTATQIEIGTCAQTVAIWNVKGPVFLASLPFGATVTSVATNSGNKLLYSGTQASRTSNLSDV